MNVSGISYGRLMPFDIDELRKRGNNVGKKEENNNNSNKYSIVDKEKFLSFIHNFDYKVGLIDTEGNMYGEKDMSPNEILNKIEIGFENSLIAGGLVRK